MGFAKFKKLVDACKWETAMEASMARGIANELCMFCNHWDAKSTLQGKQLRFMCFK